MHGIRIGARRWRLDCISEGLSRWHLDGVLWHKMHGLGVQGRCLSRQRVSGVFICQGHGSELRFLYYRERSISLQKETELDHAVSYPCDQLQSMSVCSDQFLSLAWVILFPGHVENIDSQAQVTRASPGVSIPFQNATIRKTASTAPACKQAASSKQASKRCCVAVMPRPGPD